MTTCKNKSAQVNMPPTFSLCFLAQWKTRDDIWDCIMSIKDNYIMQIVLSGQEIIEAVTSVKNSIHN